MKSEEKRKQLMLKPYINFAKEKNCIWTILVNQNLIVEGDLDTETCHVVDCFSLEPENGSYGNWFVNKVGDCLYINFTVKKEIYIYNLKTKEWKSVAIKEPDMEIERTDVWFGTDFVQGDNYWKIGTSYPGIIKYNFINEKVVYVDSWRNIVEEHVKHKKNPLYFGLGKVVRGEHILLPFYEFPAILELDQNTLQFKIYTFAKEYIGFRVISGDDKELWIETLDGRILCVDKCWNETVICIPSEFEPVAKPGKKFWPAVILEHDILLFPDTFGKILVIDRERHVVLEHWINAYIEKGERCMVATTDIYREKDKLFFFFRNQSGDFYYCEFQLEGCSFYVKQMFFANEEEITVSIMRNENASIYEDTTNTLCTFIKSVTKGKGKIL